jgi:hypothetical protein
MNRLIAIVLLLVLVPQVATGQPNVSFSGSGINQPDLDHVSGSCGTSDDLWDVEITLTSAFSGGTVTVTRSCAGQGLRNVTVVGSGGSSFLVLTLGSHNAQFNIITSVDASGSARPVRANLYAHHIHAVSVSDLYQIYSREEVHGPINILNTSGSGLSPIVREINVGAIGYQGVISGDIINNYGTIEDINCYADGLIGGLGSPVTLRATAYSGVIYTGDVNANFYGPVSGSPPMFYRVTAASGDFNGEVQIASFPTSLTGYGIFVPNGSLNATVVMQEALPASASIEVDQLGGQIIINAEDDAHDWDGDVEVDATTISGPYYAHTHTSLGGGAIGLVPFNVNDVDCEPENDSTVCEVGTRDWDLSSGEDIRETLVIRHYGPVFEVGGALPVVVESVDLACPIPGNCPTWQDISSSCDVLVAPDAAGREVWVSLTPTGSPATPIPFAQVYSYRVTPRTYNDCVTRTYLRSDGTGLSTAPNVYSYTYGFTVMCSPP